MVEKYRRLPAFPILFSDHDIMVKNFRRYRRKSFETVIAGVPGLRLPGLSMLVVCRKQKYK